jgi:chaperonin GroEL (HSP60 family)
LDAGLRAPLKQIMINTGTKEEFLPKWSGIYNPKTKNIARNFVTGNCGPFLSVGVADPVDVLIAQIDSAVSIACMLITSTGFIVEHSDKKEE